MSKKIYTSLCSFFFISPYDIIRVSLRENLTLFRHISVCSLLSLKSSLTYLQGCRNTIPDSHYIQYKLGILFTCPETSILKVNFNLHVVCKTDLDLLCFQLSLHLVSYWFQFFYIWWLKFSCLCIICPFLWTSALWTFTCPWTSIIVCYFFTP